MTTDLNAAAERILAGRESAEFLMSDARALARAYLAEHPADDVEAIDAEWLRAATSLPVCKSGSGGYSDSEVTLFLKDWESSQKNERRFWVLTLRDDKAAGWRASVSVQDEGRHAGTLYMASIKTRGQFRRLCEFIGIELQGSK